MRIISIKGTNITLTDSITDTIEKKLVTLSKLTEKMEPVAEMLVEVGKSTRHHRKGPFWRAEATLHLPGKVLRAEGTDISLYGSIDSVKDELARQIKSYKERLVARVKRGGRLMKKMTSLDPDALAPGEVDPSRRHREEGG
ncbi:ribosome-associated translation inhibitor RaiA [Candidatus Uhrbacteria bacterium]|nr:ribosome-associated translation inhibitor RaiA [Candidatus Uhrbacteria bacterium]